MGVYREELVENRPRYNGTALYMGTWACEAIIYTSVKIVIFDSDNGLSHISAKKFYLNKWWFTPIWPISEKQKSKLECAASNGNRYPPYPQVMATAISK